MSSSDAVSRVRLNSTTSQVSSQKKNNYKTAAKITAIVVSILGFAALGCFIFHQYVGFQAAGTWINQTFSNIPVWQGIVYISVPVLFVGNLVLGVAALKLCLQSKKAQSEDSKTPSSPTSEHPTPAVDPSVPPDSVTGSASGSQHNTPAASPAPELQHGSAATSPEGSESGSVIVNATPERSPASERSSSATTPEEVQSPVSQLGFPVTSPTVESDEEIEVLQRVPNQPETSTRYENQPFIESLLRGISFGSLHQRMPHLHQRTAYQSHRPKIVVLDDDEEAGAPNVSGPRLAIEAPREEVPHSSATTSTAQTENFRVEEELRQATEELFRFSPENTRNLTTSLSSRGVFVVPDFDLADSPQSATFVDLDLSDLSFLAPLSEDESRDAAYLARRLED